MELAYPALACHSKVWLTLTGATKSAVCIHLEHDMDVPVRPRLGRVPAGAWNYGDTEGVKEFRCRQFVGRGESP